MSLPARRSLSLLVVLLGTTALAAPLTAQAQDAPLRGVALVIGESDYDQLQDLDNPKRDARAMDDLLDALGFEVERVLDGDADKLRGEIADFIDEARDADVALVYYSGHGIEAAGGNYLVPTDADLSSPQAAGASLVPVADLLAELARTVPVTIVLLDACRTNSFPPGTLVQLPGTDAAVAVDPVGLEAVRGPTPLARPDTPPDSLGMVIGFAASPGQPALDGEPDGNSPYAAALLKHFAAGGYSFGDLMTLVTEEVYLKTRARQLPWVNSSLRRVLSFGKPAEETTGDEAAIRQGRRQLLLTIAGAPEATRRYVETVADAEGVPLDALYGMLKVLGVEPSAEPGQLEAQLKTGAERLKAMIASQTGAARSDPELQRLGGLADEAQAEGAIEVALAFRQRASERADELEAAVDRNEANLKADRLQIGATYADHATTAALNFDYRTSIEMWRKAIDQVADWDAVLAGGYSNNLGVALMDQGTLELGTAALDESATMFEAALRVFDRDSLPLDWARTQSNLGNVLQILGDREGDPARYEAAAAAHRAALEELTRQDVPFDWATAENNLGNALARIGENEEGTDSLVAAIDAFHLALEVRTRAAVPLDWAATQDNLGSALSSLAARTGDAELFQAGIEAFRASLGARTSGTLDWAFTERNLGLSLKTLGVMSDDAGLIAAGADAYRAALTVFTRARAPQDFAQTSAILGFALMELVKRGEGTRAILEEARAMFEVGLEIYGSQSDDDAAYFQGRIDEIDGMLGG
jgi:uncharacterized caspase-like protein